MSSGLGTCWTPTSLWKELRSAGPGTHNVIVELDVFGEVKTVRVKR